MCFVVGAHKLRIIIFIGKIENSERRLDVAKFVHIAKYFKAGKMASEYFLLKQIEQLLVGMNNSYWSLANRDPVVETARLKILTQHYNGYIREKAVLCLGLMREISALPELIIRVNDWAEPVRRAARQSIKRLLTANNIIEFRDNLPDFIGLLNCSRDNHQILIDEILNFLSLPDNKSVLFDGLFSINKNVARLSLNILIERRLFPQKQIFHEAMRNSDPLVRMMAAKYQLTVTQQVDEAIINDLLEDSFAPIKQIVLQYIIDNQLIISCSQLSRLLFDKNALVRQRVARLLTEQRVDPKVIYLDAYNAPDSRVLKRKIALLGLNEHHYKNIVEIAERCMDEHYSSLYICALKITILHKRDEARDMLFSALCHPSVIIAKAAVRIFFRQKIYLTLAELQNCLKKMSSITHLSLYYSLARKLNKWDWIIFILDNSNMDNSQLTQEYIYNWINNFNHSWIAPNAKQKEKICQLIDAKPSLLSKHTNILNFFCSTN